MDDTGRRPRQPGDSGMRRPAALQQRTRSGKYCLHCLDPIYSDEQTEKAVTRNLVAVGLVHSGFCAHAWQRRQRGDY